MLRSDSNIDIQLYFSGSISAQAFKFNYDFNPLKNLPTYILNPPDPCNPANFSDLDDPFL